MSTTISMEMAVTDTPPDWVLIEAAKRCGWTWDRDDTLQEEYECTSSFRALCDMIQKYEQPPVDRKLLCAREAMARAPYMKDHDVRAYREGKLDQPNQAIDNCIRAITLWENGFQK